ncbi:NADH-quinone oxidoreductase subunit L [Haloferula luteola]|uniref:NADH-quinone oxidoreductase subunit L n=1 Tax=Haloferula luteola TaxID=595692 RepID=A0A840UYE4_9BACT|nr:NADH-quinone oxidoreductase subunit L [Haloferula luteola]MBB5349846.1 NADH-quinone oxidoreductase subunit L [Haloferula luteola]
MLPWLLLLLPLCSAAVNQLYLKRNAFLASMLSVASVVVTLIVSFLLLGKTDGGPSYSWISIGDFQLPIQLKLDALSTGMMIVVTGIGALVHIFSLAYMAEDGAKARFFTCLSLFMFSMTGIVLAGNFIMTFIFWELVGLSSYLLIGHWYEKDSAADAANKAFMVNRVGDFGFLIGILLTFGLTGTFVFDDMKVGLNNFAALHPDLVGGLLAAAILCVFCGAVGKSAQMPLHVWLPDAMEGPTPVSALIHAATMVAAGVYMLFRVQLSLGAEAFEGVAGNAIAWVGGFTSLCAALMATQQNDIKRVLAYSTLSQLGYMVMAVGLGGAEAGMFHLFTHAWFKALLFLGSGAVIYACHHEQDIWKMGGLIKKMPITTLTFAIGTAALIAVPFVTSGFYSKEEILATAYAKNKILFGIAVFVAFLTTFYMTRAFVVAFLGKPRDHGSDHAHEVGPLMLAPLCLLALMAIGSSWLTKPLSAVDPRLIHHAEEHAEGHLLILGLSAAALVLGLLAGFLLYRGKDKDPIDLPLLQNRFYIDVVYEKGVVKLLQDGLAALIHFLDVWVINGLLVGGSARLSQSFGNLFRRAQAGNLQGYAFLLGIGVVLVIYFTTFWN